jgi:hypothetical protein
MKKIILVAFLAISASGHAQLGDLLTKGTGGKSGKLKLFKEEKFDYPQYKNHIGEVCFSNEPAERTLPESKYIKTYKLGDKLTVRSWLATSPANSVMLQLEENGLSPKEINQAKAEIGKETHLKVMLYLDGKFFDWESSSRIDKEEDITKLPTFRFELNDGTADNFFGEDLYVKVLKRTDLLMAGTHKIKIELVPYTSGYGLGKDVNFKPVAVGEIDMIVPEVKPTAENCWPYKALADAALEAEVLKAVKKNRPNAFKVILNSSIHIIRDEYNSIVCKAFNATIVSKTADRVWYDVFRFDQLFDGTGYMSAVISKDMENALLPKEWTVNKECLKFLK